MEFDNSTAKSILSNVNIKLKNMGDGSVSYRMTHMDHEQEIVHGYIERNELSFEYSIAFSLLKDYKSFGLISNLIYEEGLKHIISYLDTYWGHEK